LIVVGVVILLGAQDMRVPLSTTVSPRLIPEIVGFGTLLTGGWYLLVILLRSPVGGRDEDAESAAPSNWLTLLELGIGLVLFAVLIEPIGFILASAVMFTVTATAMGSRRLLVNAALGLALALAAFLVFDTWLGVRLPRGWLDSVLPS
jgi:putative tricarboxylic transport membrane protein